MTQASNGPSQDQSRGSRQGHRQKHIPKAETDSRFWIGHVDEGELRTNVTLGFNSMMGILAEK